MDYWANLAELRHLLSNVIERIEALEEDSPENIARREWLRRDALEHPERYGTFSPKLFSKKVQEQFRKSEDTIKIMKNYE